MRFERQGRNHRRFLHGGQWLGHPYRSDDGGARQQRGRMCDHADAATLRVAITRAVEVPCLGRRRKNHQQQAKHRRPAD